MKAGGVTELEPIRAFLAIEPPESVRQAAASLDQFHRAHRAGCQQLVESTLFGDRQVAGG